MRYVSIDIETTGLDSETCQILSIGAVIENTNTQQSFEEIPKFHCVIPHKNIHGEPYALNMNKDLVNLITTYNKLSSDINRAKLALDNDVIFIEEDEVFGVFKGFLIANGLYDSSNKVTIVGKNYQGFDQKFLNKLPGWESLNFHRRIGDPAILFVDWANDEMLPDLTTCKQRAGLEGEVTHNALEDAYDVVKVLRTKY